MRRRVNGALLAMALLAPAAGAEAAEIILYDFFDFQGAAITLTQSAPDLDQYNFDNDLESFRILSGYWSIHRDDDFQNGNGPPLSLGPGDYPNIEDLGFPQDRASSVLLVQQSPPATPDCPAPYQALGSNGYCVFTCAPGTEGDRASGQCICMNSLFEIGADADGRRICGPRRVELPSSDAPIVLQPPALQEADWVRLVGLDIDNRAYQTFDRDVALSTYVTTSPPLQGARLEYRAIEGPLTYDDNIKVQMLNGAQWRLYRDQNVAQPVAINFQLSADAGEIYVYFQIRGLLVDASNRMTWIHSPPHVGRIMYTPSAPSGGVALQQVPAAQAHAQAIAAGFSFVAESRSFATTQCAFQVIGQRLAFNISVLASLDPAEVFYPRNCGFALFVGRSLAPGWDFGQQPSISFDECSGPNSNAWYSDWENPDNPAYDIWIDADITYQPDAFTNCLIRRWSVSHIPLIGPAGADWRRAFD